MGANRGRGGDAGREPVWRDRQRAAPARSTRATYRPAPRPPDRRAAAATVCPPAGRPASVPLRHTTGAGGSDRLSNHSSGPARASGEVPPALAPAPRSPLAEHSPVAIALVKPLRCASPPESPRGRPPPPARPASDTAIETTRRALRR